MSDQDQVEDKRPPSREEAIAMVVELLEDGEPVPRSTAQNAAGEHYKIEWWDDQPVWVEAPDLRKHNLQPGHALSVSQFEVPDECWKHHRYMLKSGEHGVALADDPSVTLLVATDKGLRFLVGYAAA